MNNMKIALLPLQADDREQFIRDNQEAFNGTFHKCGRKFNRWYNMIWMEKIIGTHPDG